MAKRFTDTSKWEKAWFRKLSPKMKCVWDYLTHRCDHAGIWSVDLESMSFHVGEDVTQDELIKSFGDRITFLADKVFLPGFVEFQYGHLNPSNRVHKSVLDRLEKLGASKPLASPLEGAKDKDKDTDKDKDKDKDKDPEIKLLKKFDFEALYRKYPRKEGKSAGLKQCAKQIKTQEDYDALSLAVDRYAEHCRKTQQIVLFFGSFLGSERTAHPWRDWTEPETGTTTIGDPNQLDWTRVDLTG